MRWGITLPLGDLSLREHRALVTELSELGYTDVWTAETTGTDAFTPLALAAEWAPRLRLGTAIAPVFTRGPGLLAMQAATLAELAPERFALGIGTSSPVIVRNWNAAEFTEPLHRVRDTVRFLRAALAGEKVTEEYRTFSVNRFKLERPPAIPPRLLLAALRPGMLRLAAAEADGAITNWLSPTDVRTVRAELGPEPELVARIFVCPTEDAQAARAIGRFAISSYLTVPAYAAFHDWLGRGVALRGMHDAWQAGERKKANELIPDSVVDELVVHGSIEQCRARIAEYVHNGLDTPVIGLMPAEGEQQDLVRALHP